MLRRLELSGFKSIKQATIDLNPINVLIGANGAGKSNLVSFFDMLQHIIRKQLQLYIARQGYANSVLHFGSKITPYITALIKFETTTGEFKLNSKLGIITNDRLVFEESHINFDVGQLPVAMAGIANQEADLLWLLNDFKKKLSNGPESHFGNVWPSLTNEEKDYLQGDVLENLSKLSNEASIFLAGITVYHVHDTSFSSQLRRKADVGFNRYLAQDGGNLASVLYRLKTAKPSYYQRIVRTTQQIAPFFSDFVLEPEIENPDYIELRWLSKNSDYEFGVHQLSDGTLRAMVFITLLLQPEENLPSLIVIDEPELGLHPYALNIVVGLAKSVRHHGSQIILATQSAALLDHFEPEDIIVVEQRQGESIFKRHTSEDLKGWLEDYTLSELWEKNVLGGHPSQ